MLHRTRIALTTMSAFGLVAACTGAPLASSELAPAARGAATCRTSEVGVQVLGSGGPVAEGSRAGTSYAVWVDGSAQLLIDAGPGSFIRFGEAGLKVGDFKAIALTHFHGDHSAGLAGILNSGSFEPSRDPLLVIGPAAANVFPGTGDFLAALFDRENGAWGYLGGYLDGSDGRRPLDVREFAAVDPDLAPTRRVEVSAELAVIAIPVHHGEVPTLAYLVQVKGRKIVFAADQSAFSSGFDRLTQDLEPDLLVAHHVIPEGAGQPVGLHRAPHSIGAMAANMAARHLVLSHNMTRSLDRLEEGTTEIAKAYSGTIAVADDGQCFPL